MDAPCKVLFVEDDPDDARLVREALADAEGKPFRIKTVDRLEAALATLAEPDAEFDVVVLDMNLPDSRGMSTFRRVFEAVPNLPIVILSAEADEDFAIRAVQSGAEDYLVKGHEDAFWLARSLRYAIERKRERARWLAAETELKRRQEQFRIARRIQQKLFPSQAPDLPGFDISGAAFPAEETGGDYFDYLQIAGGDFGIVIGDVSGHGIGPALLMAETHAYMRAVTRTYADLEFILRLVNDLLSEDIEGGRLITLFLLRLSPRLRTFQYAGAGHPAFLFDASGDVRTLYPQSRPLGIDAETPFSTSKAHTLKPGDMLLLATDGTWEPADASDEPYGMSRMLELVAANRLEPAAEIIRRLRADVRSFAEPLRDDMTLVVVKSL